MENEVNRVVPRHIAIIMDGNGRWAQKRGYERVEGHRMGAVAVKNLVENMKGLGVKFLTLYAFSTENWKRSKEEVDALMALLVEFMDANISLFMKNNLRLLISGRISGLPELQRNKVIECMKMTEKNTEMTVVIALNYGGRCEIADAAKAIAEKAVRGEIDPEKIDEKMFAENLYLPEVPDPELMIRTSGELRLSNFLLWELSYSEIYVTDTLWPDFDIRELNKAIDAFGKRSRRFGGR